MYWKDSSLTIIVLVDHDLCDFLNRFSQHVDPREIQHYPALEVSHYTNIICRLALYMNILYFISEIEIDDNVRSHDREVYESNLSRTCMNFLNVWNFIVEQYTFLSTIIVFCHFKFNSIATESDFGFMTKLDTYSKNHSSYLQLRFLAHRCLSTQRSVQEELLMQTKYFYLECLWQVSTKIWKQI